MVDSLKKIGTDHWCWVERMGWHNKTPLETIALIGSEIGEVAGEIISEDQSKIGEELADVLLRICDMATTYKVDLDGMVDHLVVEYEGQPILEMMRTFGNLVNTARMESLGDDFKIELALLAKQAILLSDYYECNIFEDTRKKMAKNELRGNRGRIC